MSQRDTCSKRLDVLERELRPCTETKEDPFVRADLWRVESGKNRKGVQGRKPRQPNLWGLDGHIKIDSALCADTSAVRNAKGGIGGNVLERTGRVEGSCRDCEGTF